MLKKKDDVHIMKRFKKIYKLRKTKLEWLIQSFILALDLKRVREVPLSWPNVFFASKTQVGVNCPAQASRNQCWNGVGVNGTIPFRSGAVKSYLPSEVAIREIMRNWPCMSCDCCTKRRDDSRVSKLCWTRVKGLPKSA